MFTVLDVLPPIKGVRGIADALFFTLLLPQGERVRDNFAFLPVNFPKVYSKLPL